MFDKGFLDREKEMLGEHGSLGLTGPDESDFIGDAGRIDGFCLLPAGRKEEKGSRKDKAGRVLSFEVRRRLLLFWGR